jgi:uncharacterized protein YbjT (DUF2867 family)
MDVVVAGGHGKIGQRTLRLLAARGDRARGIVRNPDHVADLEELGAEAIVCDMEQAEAAEIGPLIAGADTVVFAAGAGPGSGAARKRTVDYGAAVKLIEACRMNEIRRYLMVSALGANHPHRWSEEMRPYWRAKADADTELEASRLDHTIVRPGSLTDDEGSGRVEVAPSLDREGKVARDDVAAVLVACLDEPATIRLAFDLLQGETPIAEALRALASTDSPG